MMLPQLSRPLSVLKSAKSLRRPGIQQILSMVEKGEVKAIIVAKLDRLTRSVKDLCRLLELFGKRGVALISVAESLDTATAAGLSAGYGDLARTRARLAR